VRETRHARTNIRICTQNVFRRQFHKFYDFFSIICVHLNIFMPLVNKIILIVFRIIIASFNKFVICNNFKNYTFSCILITWTLISI